MATIALIVHGLRPEAVSLAQETAAWLTDRGHEVRVLAEDADAIGLGEHGCEPEKLPVASRIAPRASGEIDRACSRPPASSP